MAGSQHQFLDTDGDSAKAIREADWSASVLGPIDRWPAVLKTTIAMMLRSAFPKALVWGPELITFHNDAFRPILGEKPPAIGLPFSEVWAEAWDTIGPFAGNAMNGKATFIENLPLTVNRNGSDEQAYFTFCYSPVVDFDGRVLGFMDTVIETTQQVLA
ncbi:sensor histidine kinase, partial [Rhizobiaceae sp. 2RAB30]